MTDADRLERLETTIAYQEQSIEDLNRTVLEQAAAAPDLAHHVRQMVAINPIHAALRAAALRDMRLLGTPPRALKSRNTRNACAVSAICFSPNRSRS